MSCRYIYNGKTYELSAFDDLLRAMAPAEASQFMPAVKSVPSAPFVSRTDAWVALAIKRITKMAVDEGYDRVAFVNGEQSAERYGLSKQVRSIEWTQRKDGNRTVTILPLNGNGIEFGVEPGGAIVGIGSRGGAGEFSGKQLDDVVGKDMAAKIMAEESGDLSGNGLKVGGKGMADFYDKIVPSVAKEVVRKLGGGQMTAIDFGTGNRGDNAIAGISDAQPGFDITPKMREMAADGVPLFKRGAEDAAPSVRAARVRKMADRITAKWANAPTVTVVENMQDPAIPQAVRDEDARQRESGATGDPAAVTGSDGTVYLVASAIHTEKDAIDAVLHESLGHFGLRGTFGRELGVVLDRIATLNAGKVRAKARQYGLDFDKQSDRRIAAEEVLAEMAQDNPQIGWVKRAIAAIRTWLRDTIPGYKSMRLSDDEIVRSYLAPARNFVVKGTDGQAAAVPSRRVAPAFVRDSDIESQAFKDWSRNAPLIRSAEADAHDFKTGEHIVVEAFHGTARPDRVGTKFLAKRATSGPMAYFTSNPEVASSYATGKQDTSRASEDNEFPTWFKVKMKGDRSTTPIDRAWFRLTSEQKASIMERMPDVRLDDENNVIYEKGGGDLGNYQWELQQTQRGYDRGGNPLAAGVKSWLESGAIFDDEQKFMDVLKLAGFPMETVSYDSPHDAFPFVYKTFVRMSNPLVVADIPKAVHDRLADAAKSDRSRAKPELASDMWDKNNRTLKQWITALDGADGTDPQYAWTSIPDKVTDVLKSMGFDGIVDTGGKGGGRSHLVYIPFGETQVKSAMGNKGTFSDAKNDIRFSRTMAGLMNDVADYNLPAGYKVGDLLNSAEGKLSWWHKTVGTPFNLAKRNAGFARVYDAVQEFINGTATIAKQAANLAPRILPSLDTWSDLTKSPLSAADTKALSRPVFEGTLTWARGEDGKPVSIADREKTAEGMSSFDKAQQLFRDGHVSEAELKSWQASPLDIYDGAVNNRYEANYLKAGIVWTDAELRSMFGMNDSQIGLYKEFRAATDQSLGDLSKSEMLRIGGQDIPRALRDQTFAETDSDVAALALRDFLFAEAEKQPERADILNGAADRIMEVANKVKDLKAKGYAPLTRFGGYSLDIVDADGKRVYFSLFENKAERAKMARQMRAQFPTATQVQGTVSQEAYKQFAGVSPETVELFGNILGLDSTGDAASDKAFQEFLKQATATRSSMRRLIHRKGIAGFSEDAGRVLAAFIVSNSRRASSNNYLGEADRAVADLVKDKPNGELADQAVKMLGYVKNPQEEAVALRGLLFAQYLGGSVASAMVNATQPFVVSLPRLAMDAGAIEAGRQLKNALKLAMQDSKKSTGDAALDAAMHKHEAAISPQEVHQLQGQAGGKGSLISGDGTKAGDAYAKGRNLMKKTLLAWGKVFSVAEQFNRRITFIAAYRIGIKNKVADAGEYAAGIVAETQFTYNKGNKPAWAKGAIGATVFTFKTYSIQYLELLNRMWGQGPEGKKATLLALSIMFMLSGADGLPFAQNIDDLIDGFLQHLGYNFSSTRAKREFFAGIVGEDFGRFFEKGLTALPGVPIDLSGRIGMGKPLPGTGLALKKADHGSDVAELAGPVADLGKRAGQAVGKLFDGDIGGAMNIMQATATRNIVKGMDMLKTDSYRDSKGRKVIDTTVVEAIFKMIGFQPATVSRVQGATGEVMQMVELTKLVQSELNLSLAQAMFENDEAAKADLAKMRDRWNENNPEMKVKLDRASALRRLKEMRLSKTERIAKTAPVGMRQSVKDALEAAS